jgi:hypothetical protein
MRLLVLESALQIETASRVTIRQSQQILDREHAPYNDFPIDVAEAGGLYDFPNA